MFRNMVTSLFKYDRIRTTDVKAKEVRRWADQIITLAKRGDLHARRQAMAIMTETDVVHKLFEDANQRFGAVAGGYTRVIKMGRRAGDAACISVVELISAKAEGGRKPDLKKTSIEKTVPVVAVEPAVKSDAPVVTASAEATAPAAEE